MSNTDCDKTSVCLVSDIKSAGSGVCVGAVNSSLSALDEKVGGRNLGVRSLHQLRTQDTYIFSKKKPTHHTFLFISPTR